MRIHSKPDRNQSKLSACTTDYNCNNVLVVTQSRRPFEIESPPNKRWDDKPFRGQEVKAASTATASATTQVPNGPNPPKIRALDVTHCLGMSYYVNFLGGLGSNNFHIK